MHTAIYNPPVDKLLTYLAVETGKELEWVNYSEKFGFEPEHIPELIRMATDAQLMSEEADDLEFTAPIHAIRALTQMHAEAAIEPLIPLLDESTENEWIQSDLTEFYSVIGLKALSPLQKYMADTAHEMYARSTAGNAIADIGIQHPEARIQSIEILSQQLEATRDEASEFNAFIIGNLIKLKAVEAVSTIEKAFSDGYVDEYIYGDWNEVQVELGLKERQEGPLPSIEDIFPLTQRGSKRQYTASDFTIVSPPLDTPKTRPASAPKGIKNKDTKKAKAKKMAKASRKQNRK